MAPDLIAALQLSIGPAILISGVGLILLSMTNRFGRVIDRARTLTREFQEAASTKRADLLAQLRILSTRARVIRTGIAFAALSVLLAALLVMSLFVGALLQLGIAGLIGALFIFCLLSLISALFLFISDINLSLKALWIEMPPESR